MYKKLISSILVVALLNLLSCYSSELVTVGEYNQFEEEDKPDDIRVKTKDNQEYHISNSDYYIKNDTLYAKTKMILTDMEQPFEGKFALSEIKYIQFLAPDRNYSLVSVSQYMNIEVESGKPNEIDLTKYDYTRYHFMKKDYYIENDTLYGKGKLLSGDREVLLTKKIPLLEIESIRVENVNWSATTLLCLGIFFVGLVIVALASGNFGYH